MKLRNKLLPLVGIAAVAATVAPLATSCANKINMLDITKGYTPKIKASVSEWQTQQGATQLYIDDVKKNPEIFKEDFIYGVHNKVTKAKNEFLNSATIWPDDISATNFKLNSLKAGVSNPTFGKTDIYYPGEKYVTYPTVSFEYNIQINYTYEYLGQMYSSETMFSESEEDGYHARTVSLETTIKYTNVPFLAIAHQDIAGRTYWQVSPLDTMAIAAEEAGEPFIHYYNQAYMFEYMTDDWSIDINASANVEHKQVTSSTSYVTNSTPTFNLNINTWDILKKFTTTQSIGSDSYDLANYQDMLLSFANFGFESYYLQSVEQKPELQTNGYMQGAGSIDNKVASFGAFYMPQTVKSIQLYAGYEDEAQTKPKGAITLTTSSESEKLITLTFEEGLKLSDNAPQYGVDNQKLSWEGTKPTSGIYNFMLPKTIVALITPTDSKVEPFTQTVYLNQDYLPILLTADK